MVPPTRAALRQRRLWRRPAVTPKFAFNDIFDFWYFRQPANNVFTETDYAGTSMLQPPGAATTTTTPDYQALNQKTKRNTFFVNWDVNPFARLTLGYRYTSRIITDAGGDFIPIHENWSLFGIVFRPTPQLRANFNFDWMYADNSFTRISPRQLQHYVLRTSLQGEDMAQLFRDHQHPGGPRQYPDGKSPRPQPRLFLLNGHRSQRKLEHRPELFVRRRFLNYARVLYRYPVVEGTPQGPPVCHKRACHSKATAITTNRRNTAPSDLYLPRLRSLHAVAGYRMSDTDGQAPPINIRQVPGSLQSQYQTPYGTLAYDLTPNWTWKANYDYYSYGEGTPIGPTLPRSFRGNVYTLGFAMLSSSCAGPSVTPYFNKEYYHAEHITAIAIGLVVLFASVTSLAQATGADTYKAKCQMCHGADGLGNTPAGKAMNAHPFNSPDVLKESDADLTTIIKSGKDKMPAFSGKLTDAQITDVLGYIHTLQKK